MNYTETEIIKQKTSTQGTDSILCTRHEFQLSLVICILQNREGSLFVMNKKFVHCDVLNRHFYIYDKDYDNHTNFGFYKIISPFSYVARSLLL